MVCGGGFLGGKKLDSFMHLYQININTKFNKPVYIMGTSIEPINNRFLKNLTEKILKKTDFVFSREKITEQYLSTFLPREKHEIIPDMAFYLKNENNNKKIFRKEKSESDLLIGITVRNWNFPNSDSKKDSLNNYITSIEETIEYFIKNYNCIFVFIPQVIVKHGDDSEIAEMIRGRMPIEYQKKFIIRKDDWSPYEIKEAISEMDGFVGTRMHSNIFATSKYIPTVAIAYEKKTNGIMHTLDLDEYIVEIDTINSHELIEKIIKMIDNKKEIKDKLQYKIGEIRLEIKTKVSNLLLQNTKGDF